MSYTTFHAENLPALCAQARPRWGCGCCSAQLLSVGQTIRAVPQSTAEELEQPGGKDGLTRSFWHGCGTLRLEKHCSQGSQSSWSGGSAAAHLVTAAAVTSSWLIYSCVTLQVARYSKSSLIIKLQGHDPINSTAVKILGWTGVFFCTLFGYVCT